MKKVTQIVGIIAMVAILVLAVSCSKNEASSGTNGGGTETAAPADKSGDSFAGTVWEGTNGRGVEVKFTFAETGSMVLQQWSNGQTSQAFYKVFGDTVMLTFDDGNVYEYVITGDTMTRKDDFITASKVK